jgi:tripartite-type tricarboxylate transporter receptor subunit TctC
MMHQLNIIFVTLIACLFHVAGAFAQPSNSLNNYPIKPIRLINPLGSGGTAEALARTAAKALSDQLGQAVVVETKTGAAGTIGADYVAKSPPDGYTLLYGVTGTNTIAPSLYKLPYDPIKDLIPITIAFAGPNVLLVNQSLGVNSLQELIALAKAKPNQLSFASAGNGSMSHLNGELLKQYAGIDLLHVPYKGGGSAMPDLLSGRVNMMIETSSGVMPLIRTGRVKALAVTSIQRSPLLPDVPTFAELGFPGIYSVVWGGLFAPAGTPKIILDKIHNAIQQENKDAAYKEMVTTMNNEAVSMTPDEFRIYVNEDLKKYSEIVKRINLKLD